MKKITKIILIVSIIIIITLFLIFTSIPKKYIHEESLNCNEIGGVCMNSKEDCLNFNNSIFFDHMGCEELLDNELAICCKS
ncbi:MAG: hypothetical protein AB7V77_00530 [Candidatus Woesearchaeota archaeon]